MAHITTNIYRKLIINMGKKSPKIAKELDIKKTKVTNKKRDGSMEAMSKDTENKDGLSVCIAIIDKIFVA